MLGGDPLNPHPIDADDVRVLHGQVEALGVIVRALLHAFPDPEAARAIVPQQIERERATGMSGEHWPPQVLQVITRARASGGEVGEHGAIVASGGLKVRATAHPGGR